MDVVPLIAEWKSPCLPSPGCLLRLYSSIVAREMFTDDLRCAAYNERLDGCRYLLPHGTICLCLSDSLRVITAPTRHPCLQLPCFSHERVPPPPVFDGHTPAVRHVTPPRRLRTESKKTRLTRSGPAGVPSEAAASVPNMVPLSPGFYSLVWLSSPTFAPGSVEGRFYFSLITGCPPPSLYKHPRPWARMVPQSLISCCPLNTLAYFSVT